MSWRAVFLPPGSGLVTPALHPLQIAKYKSVPVWQRLLFRCDREKKSKAELIRHEQVVMALLDCQMAEY